MHEIETWAPGSAACALCVINISSHETGRPAGRAGGGGPGPMGPPLDPPLQQNGSRKQARTQARPFKYNRFNEENICAAAFASLIAAPTKGLLLLLLIFNSWIRLKLIAVQVYLWQKVEMVLCIIKKVLFPFLQPFFSALYCKFMAAGSYTE